MLQTCNKWSNSSSSKYNVFRWERNFTDNSIENLCKLDKN